MDFLSMIIPGPYKWIALGLVALGLVGFGAVEGASHVQAKWDAQKIATEIKIVKVQVAQEKAAAKVVTKYVDRVQVVHDQAETVIKEVTKYVPAQADRDCIVPAGVIRVLDPTTSFGPLPGTANDTNAATPPTEADPGGGSLAH